MNPYRKLLIVNTTLVLVLATVGPGAVSSSALNSRPTAATPIYGQPGIGGVSDADSDGGTVT